MKRLIKNDGTLTFGYWIHTHHADVPASYHAWACERINDYDLQLERVRKGLDPIPGLKDGTKVLPVAKPPQRKVFASKSVRPCNYSPSPEPAPIMKQRSKASHYESPIRDCIARNMGYAQIARSVGLSEPTVRKYVQELGLPKPPDGRGLTSPLNGGGGDNTIHWGGPQEALIEELRGRGKSWKQIARAIQFKPGGQVLSNRYHAHVRTARLKLLKPSVPNPRRRKACVDKTVEAKKPWPPARKSLWRRFLDWFGNDED